MVNSTLLSARGVTEQLLQRAVWGASRSRPRRTAPDKTSTHAELIIDGEALASLPSQQAERLVLDAQNGAESDQVTGARVIVLS